MEEYEDLHDFFGDEKRPEIDDLKSLFDILKSELIEATSFDDAAITYHKAGEDKEINYDYIWLDDSEIKQNEDGTFRVTDLHANNDTFNCTGSEVVDFYVGVFAAFESDFNPETPESFFNKGFKIAMKGLFKLEESNSSHSRNLN